MAKQFAISTRSFDKFQEKEAFSGILPEGLSQNIILRVFIQLQEFFSFDSSSNSWKTRMVFLRT